ncbi:MAG: DNA polymerase III subunit delta' [Pseudomonadota bacterium]
MSSTEALPLIGHGEAEATFRSAFASGRLHHGWLLAGPSGIGKSILATRLAAIALGAQSPSFSDTDPVVQKIIAGSHPDLRWLDRRPDDKGKLPQDISVEAVRGLNQFFSLKAALGGFRVGIVNALDELNRFGANALLKTLEEPPRNSLLILISHGSRPVLPTIRSRCRLLRLSALAPADTAAVLQAVGDEEKPGEYALKLASGRPGQGAKLTSAAGVAALNAARTYLSALPKPSDAAISDVLQKGGANELALECLGIAVLDWLAENANERPAAAKAWLACSEQLSDGRDLNMDAGQSTAKLIATLQAHLAR